MIVRIASFFVAAVIASSASLHAQEPVTYADFGIRMLQRETTAAPDRNVIVSPLSAGLALSMAYDGAVGATATEMAQTLGLNGLTSDQLDAAEAPVVPLLTSRQNVDVEIADSAWVDNSRPEQPYPAYEQRIAHAYGASLHPADFRNPATVDAINGWISQATHGNITDLLDHLDANAALFLCNALYFKGSWQEKFDKNLTERKTFTLPDGSRVKAPRMSASRSFDYFETPDFQAVKLPYQGGFSMEVFLPAQGFGLGKLERAMSGDDWGAWQDRFESRPGTLELPKFTLHWKNSLKASLQAMGMQTAFTGAAQFYHMYPRDPKYVVYIEDVVQATYMNVDEEGTTAAAATGVTMGVAAVAMAPPSPFSMIVDRPFFCAIVDDASGTPLFFAAINDPRG
ncbi:MAG TPA: serpin family protein [Candidatus Eremiobacteraceae bacterium]|nr:serpin family protein [Candidatus Eremiobacteraceae bacterium]